jgi:hypothetical protein
MHFPSHIQYDAIRTNETLVCNWAKETGSCMCNHRQAILTEQDLPHESEYSKKISRARQNNRPMAICMNIVSLISRGMAVAYPTITAIMCDSSNDAAKRNDSLIEYLEATAPCMKNQKIKNETIPSTTASTRKSSSKFPARA